MYIEKKIYDKGLLTFSQIMNYKTLEELKEFKAIAETMETKTALLSLNSNN